MSASAEFADQLRRVLDPKDAVVAIATDGAIEIASPSRDLDRSLEVRVRGIADFEVALVMPARPGGPFEQVFTGPPEAADLVVREVLAFVCDLIAERVVLAWDETLLRGGRRFLKTTDLSAAARSDFAWVVSWRGERDWSAPAG